MWRLASLFALLLVAAVPVQAEDRISLSGLGVSLVVPDGWQQISIEEAFARAPASDAERADLQRRAVAIRRPVIVLRQLEHRAVTVPVFNVSLKELILDHTAMEVLARLQRIARDGLGTIEILDPPHPVQVSGMPAAHIRFAYTLEQSGIVTRGISEHWVVVRGGYYFGFSAGYSPDEPPETRAAIHATVDSIRIDPAN